MIEHEYDPKHAGALFRLCIKCGAADDDPESRTPCPGAETADLLKVDRDQDMSIELIRDTQRHAKLAARAVQDALANLAGKKPLNLEEVRLLMVKCARATADTLETIGQPNEKATEKLSEDHVKAVNGMRRALAKAKGENALLAGQTGKIIEAFKALVHAQARLSHADAEKAWGDLKSLGIEP